MILIIMGVSGSGKTTIGRLLASRVGWEFLDGDDFHSAANRNKMRRGIPLTDEDRAGWLAALAGVITERVALGSNTILACSALKQSYRDILSASDARVKFIFLQGEQELIAARMRTRHGHYMKPGLLDSQFETLEVPKDALSVEITPSPEEITRQILKRLGMN